MVLPSRFRVLSLGLPVWRITADGMRGLALALARQLAGQFKSRSLGPVLCSKQWGSSAAVAEAEAEDEILFPREGPGVNYALNWALAATGVPPPGEAYRNLKIGELKEHGAAEPEATSGTSIYATGCQAAGVTELTQGQYRRLLKEVTSHLSSSSKLYVHDGAVGSSPKSDAKLRTIADNPSASLFFRSTLLPTPTRIVSHDAFPLTVYVASQYSSESFGQLGLPVKSEKDFIAADFQSSTVLLGGRAFADDQRVKSVLAALAGPTILEHGALPLAARLLVNGGSTILLFAPESIVKQSPSILNAAVSRDAGVAWSSDGVARLFEPSAQRPNLYKNPASVVIVTADSTGAIPAISKIQPAQAAFHFLAGYNGELFNPAYQLQPASLDPVTLTEKFLSLLLTTGAPTFLVNANDGDKTVPDAELYKLVASTASEKLPKSKGKKPAEAAVEALKKKYNDFVTSSFPSLPEGVAL